MSLSLELSDQAVVWRLAGSALIAVMALAAIFWGGRIRKRACEKVSAAAGEQPQKKPLGMAHFFLSLAAIGGAAWAILQVWGVDTTRLMAPAGGLQLLGVIRVVVIIAIAAAALEIVNLLARTLLERVARRSADHRRRAAKLRTVAPLISGLINAMIILVAIAMVLAEAGIQVAPLLAGAGLAGIAIGFGAQSLVKDLFTGAFLVIEDIVSHGDIVEIGGVSGKVEAMTLRTIRLRSFDGTLHIFPYGEAQVIHNRTSSFSTFAFELQVSYLSRIDEALAVLKQAGEEVQGDKELARCMIGGLDLVGVDKLSDNGVILKGRIRTIAGENARIGNAFLKRVKEKRDEAGVLISHRHLPVPPYETIKNPLYKQSICDLSILVVDDHRFMQQVMLLMLKGLGVREVRSALTVDEGLNLLSCQSFDVVIADYLMGTRNGAEFTRFARSEHSTGDRFVPIIACTADTTQRTVKELRDAGADEILCKPVSPTIIWTKLTAVTHARRNFVTAPDFFGPDRRRRVRYMRPVEDRRKVDAEMV